MNLPTLPTQGPMRRSPDANGSVLASSAASFFKEFPQQRSAGDVRHMGAQVPDLSVPVQKARLLPPFRAIAQ